MPGVASLGRRPLHPVEVFYPAQAAVEVGPVGTLLTRPFVVPAGQLTINAGATGGEVRVRVPGEDGAVGESAPVACDGLAVEAGLQEPLSTLRAEPVRLEVRVRREAPFGLEFRA